MWERLGRFSQREMKKTEATRRTTPPPKKPAACGIHPNPPAASSATPSTLKTMPKNDPRSGATTPRMIFRCDVAPLREKSSSEIDPARRPRVDALPNLLNVKKMH